MADNLKSKIRSFRFDENLGSDSPSKKAKIERNPIESDSSHPENAFINVQPATDPESSSRRRKSNSKNKKEVPDDLPDLLPSIAPNLELLFIGYNPGVESSLTQHHYAHFTNLFWKLFNQSKLFLRVLKHIESDSVIEDAHDIDETLSETFTEKVREMIHPEECDNLIEGNNLLGSRSGSESHPSDGQQIVVKTESDPLLSKVVGDDETFLRPEHDNDLVRFKVGFTDLVLRCTKTAQELNLAEKLDNVPRLIGEFRHSNSRFLVFIGKGIWEIITKYIASKYGVKKFKLTKTNFLWGKQTKAPGNDKDVLLHNYILDKLQEELPNRSVVYVFPNTSGLVTSLTFAEKLQLWENLAEEV